MDYHCTCGKRKELNYKKNYIFQDEPTPAKSFKPVQVYIPSKGKWDPPTVYQRSYMPVKSTAVIVGAPPSDWRRPTDAMDTNSTYRTDYSNQKYVPPKWYHHPRKTISNKVSEPKMSEYTDKYRLLSHKQFEKATKRQLVWAKICAKKPAGFGKNAIKPPMFAQSLYMGDFKHPDLQMSHLDRSGCENL